MIGEDFHANKILIIKYRIFFFFETKSSYIAVEGRNDLYIPGCP